MSPSNPVSLLVEQLELAGPKAIAMLQGSQPLDPLVVFAALQACGLLGDRELVGNAARSRRQLLELVRTSAGIATVLSQLDLSPEAMDLEHAGDSDDLERRFDALVALSGVHAILPAPHASRTLGVLERNSTWAALHPDEAFALVPVAESHQAALDTPSTHPVHDLLDAVLDAEIEIARPAPAVMWDAAVHEAERALFPPTWAAWAQRLGDAMAELKTLLSRPPASTPAWAGSGDLLESIEHVTIGLREEEELVIRRIGRNLQLVWAGDGPPPGRATLGGEALRDAPALLRGMRAWWLDEPPEDVAEIAVLWADREWRVVLGEEAS